MLDGLVSQKEQYLINIIMIKKYIHALWTLKKHLTQSAMNRQWRRAGALMGRWSAGPTTPQGSTSLPYRYVFLQISDFDIKLISGL